MAKVDSTMTEEKIIEMVREKVYLYDKQSPHYKDAVMKNNAWTAIGNTVGLPSDQVQKIWLEIRRQYTVYLAKLAKPTGSARGTVPVFRHSGTMSFYQKYYKPYKSLNNLNGETDEESRSTTPHSDIEVEFVDFGNEATPEVVISTEKSSSTETPRSRPKKRKHNDLDERLISALEKTGPDPDIFDHFGANVAGRLRKLNELNSRAASAAQLDIQKVLYDQEEAFYDSVGQSQ